MGGRIARTALLASGLLAATGSASAQDRPTLQPSDYGQWETLGAYDLDPTGRWLAAGIRRNDETVEVRLHRTDGSADPVVLEHATGAVFSPDGRWLAYRKGVAPDEAEDSDEPVRDRLGLVDLSTGRDTVMFAVRSFAFRDDGAWLAALGYAPSDTVGADLMVMDPRSGSSTLLGNVDVFEWQDDGPLLAVALRTTLGTDAVQVLDPGPGILRTLDSRNARYRIPTWREGSSTLAVLREVEVEGRDGPSHDILVWDDAGQTSAAPRVLAAVGRADLPDSLRVTEHAGITFDASGATVFVGLRPWALDESTSSGADGAGGETGGEDDAEGDASPAAGADDDVAAADVQVWHWNDDQIIRGQEYFAAQNARRTLAAAWHLDADRLVVLGRELEEPVTLLDEGAWGIVADFTPYRVARRFGSQRADWYRVDPATGERAPLARNAPAGVETSPSGARALWFDGQGWMAADLATLETVRIDPQGSAAFGQALADYDYPGDRPPWGLAAWEEGGRVAYLYDKYDVWRADLGTGAVERLTDGAATGHEYRIVNLDPEAGFFSTAELDPAEPVWMARRHTRTKASGYAVLRDGQVHTVVEEDALVGGLEKAVDAERYALRMERWDDSPDVFVGGRDLDGLRAVTRTNPFQDDFAWGRSELVEYTTDAGHDLQAILVYPADFEEGRRYPLILYQYERLSDGLHRYDPPGERDYYNFQTWSQQGYFVLMPDIVYQPARPGPSALDAVEHALDAAVATGHVDPERMGLIGHSWGGYQAAYLPTRTNRFAASVAGAAITDFISFMGAVHWNGGLPELGHWETGQARMATPFWDNLEGHRESSPVHFIDQLETPVLLMHGDQDGVVDFRQALEYYNFARRLEKPVVLLVYPGADHGLRAEPQQVDYHRRILEWFGHYLKGEPAPRWITEGETWVEREERLGDRGEHLWFR
ncbi:MAG: prolyl oligopeptidase family serine peptidase [Longimicrobiales bacterium]